MKVHLVYPWMFPDSPYYKYLVEYPPSNIEYVNVKKGQYGIETSQIKRKTLNNIKKGVKWTRKNIFPLPNLRYINKEIDMLHCARCINLSKQPYVVDIEDLWSLEGHNKITWGTSLTKHLIEKNNCKKILPWSEYAKESFLKRYTSEKLKDKTETLYPAVPIGNSPKEKDNINILFVARYFWIKGGLIAVNTLNELSKKYDISSQVISEVPEDIQEKYSDISYLGLVSPEEVHTAMSKANLFLYPSFVDTFGLQQLEAMSHALPILTVDTVHPSPRREIVRDGITGYIAKIPNKINYYKIRKNEKKVISEIVKNTSLIIENSNLRRKMARAAKTEVEKGRFSITKRNKRLKEIYQETART